jgi:O-succinylbenzoate synthase
VLDDLLAGACADRVDAGVLHVAGDPPREALLQIGVQLGLEVADELVGRADQQPVEAAALGERERDLGGVRDEINCGVSIGLQETTAELLDKVARELDAGYQRIKIKIKPGKDIQLVEAIRSQFANITLSVDANSAYSLDRHLSVIKQLDNYQLLMIEQPLAAGDLVDHAKLQSQIKTPICLDESIVAIDDVRHAFELGSCRIVNIKLGRVGGHSEARQIQAYAAESGVPVWCGGMLESGIGRAHNIAMSTQSGFTLPGDVSASARYWEEDIIEPPVRVSERGTIKAPDAPGIGFNVNVSRIEALTVRKEIIQ